MKISVKTGALEEMQTDVCACLMSPDLDLRKARTSNALLCKAGDKLQHELHEKYLQYFKVGDIAVLHGYKLQCKHVLFGVLMPYDERSSKISSTPEKYYRKVIHDFMTKCLEISNQEKCQSISFPAIGCGNLRFPLYIVADEMFKSVESFRLTYKPLHLKVVQFVIHATDTEALKVFQDYEKSIWQAKDDHSQSNGVLNKSNADFMGTTNTTQVVRPKTKRQFSFNKDASNVQIFQTKENLQVKVYCASILNAPVDGIVNAANRALDHGGGVAKAICDAAGTDLVAEGYDYLKSHGKLMVGEACITVAGNLQYKCVIHAVGPCWDNYKPHTLDNVTKCETDLYMAVVNSLSMAERENLKTVALPAISSGVYGCPLDLCCVQYAKAVHDYSSMRKNSLQEIHFVDVNDQVVKKMQKIFNCMIKNGKEPSFYDKTIYCQTVTTRKSTSGKGNSQEHTNKNITRHHSLHGDKFSQKASHRDMDHNTSQAASDLHTHTNRVHVKEEVQYPYTDEIRWLGNHTMFFCVIGLQQNLYIYTGNILELDKTIDIIVCANNKKGKKKGELQKALLKATNQTFKNAKKDAFKSQTVSRGQIVMVKAFPKLKFMWVAYAIIFKKKDSKGEENRKKNMKVIYNAIWKSMKEKRCHTLVLPLLGKGKGGVYPWTDVEMLFESLQGYAHEEKSFAFDIHLVHKNNKHTNLVIDTVNRLVNKQNFELNGTTSHHSKATGTSYSGDKSFGRTRSMHTTRPNRHFQHSKTQNSNSSVSNDEVSRNLHIPTDNKFHTGTSDSGDKSLMRCQSLHTTSPDRHFQYSTAQNSNSSVNVDEVSRNLHIPTDDKYHNSKTSHNDPNTSYGQASTEINMSADNVKENKKHGISKKIVPDHNISRDNKKHDVYDCKESLMATATSKANVYDQSVDKGLSSNVGDSSLTTLSDDIHPNMDGKQGSTTISMPAAEVESCVICLEDITEAKTLKCGHKFCVDCIDEQFKHKKVCPTCGAVCGLVTGDQPEGRMHVDINHSAHCAGFENVDRIEITYTFPDGVQNAGHPNPGQRYQGISRTAYLPNNPKGKLVLELLRTAFERKLVFTIGRSRTTGQDGVITWNDIHHKTDHRSNTQFGYPDPTYLDRVLDELAAKGVTNEDIPLLATVKGLTQNNRSSMKKMNTDI